MSRSAFTKKKFGAVREVPSREPVMSDEKTGLVVESSRVLAKKNDCPRIVRASAADFTSCPRYFM
jgi:hypothetical protein